MSLQEELIEAQRSLLNTAKHLNAANHEANAIEHQLIIPIIGKVVEAEVALKQLRNAIDSVNYSNKKG